MTCDRDPRWTLHTPASWRGSLASRVIDLEDRGREIDSRLGFRPYAVWIVRSTWTGGRRGDGPEEITQEVPILPVPKVSDLTGVQMIVTPALVQEVGTVLVSEISGRYTEDQVRGRDPAGRPAGPNETTWWEIAFLAGCAGVAAGERMRFAVKSVPMYDADRAQWSVTLVRAHEGRARSGALR